MVNHLLETRHPLSSSAVRLCVSVCHPPSILRTHFQVPYPVSPLSATLTKTPGGIRTFFPFWFTSLRFSASLRCPYSGDVPTFRLKLPSTCGAKIPTRSGRAFLPPATLFHPWLANDSASTSLPTCTGAKRSRAPFASPRIPPCRSHGKTSIAGSKLAQDTVK